MSDSRGDGPSRCGPEMDDIAVLVRRMEHLSSPTSTTRRRSTPPNNFPSHRPRHVEFHRLRSAVPIPFASPHIPTVCRIQLQRIRQAKDKRCIPGTQHRKRCAENTRVDAEGIERVASVEGASLTMDGRGESKLIILQRQTVVSQFFQLDRLVVEGGKTGKQKGNEGGIVRQKDTG
jgi:hypothetical protein